MTYCVGLKVDSGLVLASDTRTNAGMDDIASFRKMHVWDGWPDRLLVLLSSGNLAVTQAVLMLLNDGVVNAAEGKPNLQTAANMFEAARLIGGASRKARAIDGETLSSGTSSFSASFILGGQIRGDAMRLFQIYREGNFIEIGGETRYVQIGEHKYGKPVLDRLADDSMSLGEAAKLLMLSFDSTMRSNLSVGMPLDLMLYAKDSFRGERQRIEAEIPYFRDLSRSWAKGLRTAFETIEPYGG